MGNDSERGAIIEALNSWGDRGGHLYDRLPDLQEMAASSPDAWAEAILSLVPDVPTDEYSGCLYWGLIAVLQAAPDRAAMEHSLADRAYSHRTVASLVGNVLRFGSQGAGELHAIDVLGEDFVFDTWSRHCRSWRLEDASHQPPDVNGDNWAWVIMDSLADYDPDALWLLFLRYLEHEADPRCRAQSGIAWLESINFRHASHFIDRIEDEARRNQRLREVMRGMYPPNDDPDIARRFTEAMRESTD